MVTLFEMVAGDWLNLAMRWFHVIVGIGWIGTSFHFVALDLSLERPNPPRERVAGESWLVHGGGFYRVEKYLVAPAKLPAHLHWFKWEAYLTWLTGFVLLVLIYFMRADLYLMDAQSTLSAAWGVGIALGALALGWLGYDLLCRTMQGRSDAMLGAVLFAGLAALAFGFSFVFSGRGAFMMVGAVMGTIMAANVAMVIIPNQKKTVAAMLAGRPPDPLLGRMGKQRSLHNNYFTLPVVFTMIAGHYPAAFGHKYAWLVLAGISAVGILARHHFNLRDRGRTSYWLLPASAAGLVALAVLTRPPTVPEVPPTLGPQTAPAVGFADIDKIFTAHCHSCHARRPANRDFPTPPKGVTFDTPEEIRRHRMQIYAQTVVNPIMPPGNTSHMTEDERSLVGRWISLGAPLD